MKQLLLLSLLIVSKSLFAATGTSSPPSYTKSSATTIPTPAPKAHSQTNQLSRPKTAPDKTKIPEITGDLVYYPGVVTVNEGRWVGADNFLNIGKAFSIQVNFIKPESLEITFTQEKFKEAITQIFEKNGLTTNPPVLDYKPPLPFFSLIVLVFPTADGLAAAFQGRMFEQVTLARVRFKDEVFQAITWEQTNLVYGPKEEFEKLLTKTVEGLVNTFVTRVTSQQGATKQALQEPASLPQESSDQAPPSEG